MLSHSRYSVSPLHCTLFTLSTYSQPPLSLPVLFLFSFNFQAVAARHAGSNEADGASEAACSGAFAVYGRSAVVTSTPCRTHTHSIPPTEDQCDRVRWLAHDLPAYQAPDERPRRADKLLFPNCPMANNGIDSGP